MENVITRIVKIEKQGSEEVEKSELEYRKKIDAHKGVLEEKKTRECALIIAAGNQRLEQAITEAKKHLEAKRSEAISDNKKLYQDSSLNEAIKEKLISILLTI